MSGREVVRDGGAREGMSYEGSVRREMVSSVGGKEVGR